MNVRNLILVLAAAGVLAAQSGDPGVLLQRAIRKESVEGDLKGAIDLYKKVIAGAAKNRAAAAKALLRLGECYEKQGNAEARRAYERLVKEFSDQKDQAREAEARLAAMGHTAPGVKGVVAQQLVKERNLGLAGRVTPDGRLYPFIDWDTGDIVVRDLHTGELRRVTSEGKLARSADGAYAEFPIPSRDGKRLAYVWCPGGELAEGGGLYELRVVNIDGTGVRTVSKGVKGRDVQAYDWAPDGKSVLAIVRDRGFFSPFFFGFVTVDVATSEEHRIPVPLFNFGEIDVAGFSPDGRWIVYSRRVGIARAFDRFEGKSDFDVFAIDTQTGQTTVVVQGAGVDRQPMWVPGTDQIVFRSDRDGKDSVWMVRFREGRAAGAPVLLKPDAGEYEAKGISRDGSLFYRLSHQTWDVYQATIDPETLRVRDTPTRLIETFRGRNTMPVWSPSGDAFAYYSRRGDGDPAMAERLVVHWQDGKETAVPQPVRGTSRLPHWCNTNGLIAHGTPSVWEEQIFNARTGEAFPAVARSRGPKDALSATAFSPDCKSVYFSARWLSPLRRRIYRQDLATGKETELWADDSSDYPAGAPYVSPDGRWLALHGSLPGGKAYGILILSTQGGALRLLDGYATSRSGINRWTGITWTPDSKRLLYSRPAKQGNELYWVSVEGGTPQPMGIRMPDATAPSLNTDGKRILFSAGETTNEFWVLRNLPLN